MVGNHLHEVLHARSDETRESRTAGWTMKIGSFRMDRSTREIGPSQCSRWPA